MHGRGRGGTVGAGLALLLSATTAVSAATAADPVPQSCLPQWAQEVLLHENIEKRFELVDILARPVAGACNIVPWFTEGDFNGDGKPDIAVRGRDRKSDLHGIIVLHNGERKLHGIGFYKLDAYDEKKTYKLCHLRTRREPDGKDALIVTPFKYEANTWRWTGSTYELSVESKP
jgi:hypothetical protein